MNNLFLLGNKTYFDRCKSEVLKSRAVSDYYCRIYHSLEDSRTLKQNIISKYFFGSFFCQDKSKIHSFQAVK